MSAILLDERWDALREDDHAPPGVVERRAVCWQHLAAGIVWAEQQMASGGVWIALPEGGSHERPVDIEKVSFGQGRYEFFGTQPETAVAADGQLR